MMRGASWAIALVGCLTHLSTPLQLMGQDVTVIGVLDGVEEETFGRIADLSADSLGHLAILDDQVGVVRVFRTNGAFVGVVGSKGEGPGELLAPKGIGMSRGGLLAVADLGNLRISVFQVGDGIDHEKSFGVEPGFIDVCWIGERLFALSYRDEFQIHEFDVNGTKVREFGPRFVAERELGRELRGAPPNHLNEGRIACDEDSGRVVFADRRFGRVRSMQLNGDVVMDVQIPGWVGVQMRWSEVIGTCCSFAPPGEGYFNEMQGLAIMNGSIVVSSTLMFLDGAKEIFFLDGSGVLQRKVDGGAILFGVLKDGRTYGFENEPYPRVLIR